MKKAVIVCLGFLFCVGIPALTETHRADQINGLTLSSSPLSIGKINVSYNQASPALGLGR